MRTPVADAREREAALDPARSFIVQAPAGSGKTELLIQRYLALLARVERPEEVTAITFTIKAAAEMRRRILDALRSARDEPRPEGDHQARTWDLARAALARDEACDWRIAQDVARLRIQTIDALCVSLTRQMPVVSRLGAPPRLVEDAEELYVEAARETLALLHHGDDSQAADVERLLAHVDNDNRRAEELVATLLRQRDHWLRHLEGANDRASLEEAFVRERGAAIERAARLLPSGTAVPPVDDAVAWGAFAAGFFTMAGQWRADAPHAWKDDEPLRRALRMVAALPAPRYEDAEWELLAAIVRLAHRAEAILRVVFAAHGEADFIEVARAAVRALKGDHGPTDLLLALDYRIRHILVDEFQDTSYTQFDLLEQLTSGWLPGDGRTLFVVGDPMQSIYRFREAEVALFLLAQQRGIGDLALEPLALTANFRSRESIVSWVNRAFAQVMPRAADIASGAVTYSPSVAVRDAASSSPGVTVHAFFDDDREGEARRVVELVRESRAGTTGILVRNRNHLAQIVPRLKAAGLRFRAIELETLEERPVVQDLLALACALGHLADRVSWLALLRAPWCGLTLADLHALAAERDRVVWELMSDPAVLERLSPDGCRRLERARLALSPFIEGRGRVALRDAVEGAWLALGGPACITTPTELADAEIFLDHVEQCEEGGRIADIERFRRGLDKLYAQPDLSAPEGLEVMTIHRAKGLEFDTVILPGLGAGTGRDDARLFMWMETPGGLLLAPMGPAGEESLSYKYIRALDRQKAEYECGRLLYVAATRARERLHLLGDCRRDRKGEVKTPASGSLLARLWPAVQDEFASRRESPTPAVHAPGEAAIAASESFTRLSGAPAAAIPAAVEWSSREPAARTEAIEFSWVGETSRHVGSVVHRWLQRIAEDGLRGWDPARIEALREPIRRALAARGIARSELDAAASRAIAALRASLTDARGRWILGAHRDARNEHRITAIVAGERRRLVIDRMFVDDDARCWIVDYKTSTHEGGRLEAFLAQEERRYRTQLETYAAVAGGRLPVMLGLYFPLLAGWREWEHGCAAEREALTP